MNKEKFAIGDIVTLKVGYTGEVKPVGFVVEVYIGMVHSFHKEIRYRVHWFEAGYDQDLSYNENALMQIG